MDSVDILECSRIAGCISQENKDYHETRGSIKWDYSSNIVSFFRTFVSQLQRRKTSKRNWRELLLTGIYENFPSRISRIVVNCYCEEIIHQKLFQLWRIVWWCWAHLWVTGQRLPLKMGKYSPRRHTTWFWSKKGRDADNLISASYQRWYMNDFDRFSV